MNNPINTELAALKLASSNVQPDISAWSDYDLVATIRSYKFSTKLKIDESQLSQGKVYTMNLTALLIEEGKRVRKSSQLNGVNKVFANNKTIIVEPGKISVADEKKKIAPVSQFAPGIPCSNQSEGMSIAIANAAMTTVYGLETKGQRGLSVPDPHQNFYSKQPVVQNQDKNPQDAFNFAHKALISGSSVIDQRDRLAKAIYDKGTMLYGGYVLARYHPVPAHPETDVKAPLAAENAQRLLAKGIHADLLPVHQFKFASMPSVKITEVSMRNLMSILDNHRNVRGADKGKISQLCSMMYLGDLPASLSHSIIDAVCYRAVHDRMLKLFPSLVGLSVPSTVNSTTLDLLRNHLVLHNPISPNILTFSSAYTKKPLPPTYVMKGQKKKKQDNITIINTNTIIPSPSPSPTPSVPTKLSAIVPDCLEQESPFSHVAQETFAIPMSSDLIGIQAYNHLLTMDKRNLDYQVPATHLLRIVRYPMPTPSYAQGKYTAPTTLMQDLANFRAVVMTSQDNTLFEVFAYKQMFDMPEITVIEHPIPHRNYVLVYPPKFKSNYTFADHFKRVASANVWRTYFPLHRKVYWQYDNAFPYRPLLVSKGHLKSEYHEMGYVLEKSDENNFDYGDIDDKAFEEFVKVNPPKLLGSPQIRDTYGLASHGDVLQVLPPTNNNAVNNNNTNNDNNLPPPSSDPNRDLLRLAAAANNQVSPDELNQEIYLTEEVDDDGTGGFDLFG